MKNNKNAAYFAALKDIFKSEQKVYVNKEGLVRLYCLTKPRNINIKYRKS